MELPLAHKQKNTCFHNVEIREYVWCINLKLIPGFLREIDTQHKYGVNKSMGVGDIIKYNPLLLL